MGSSASKPVRSAAGAAARQYPKKPSPTTTTTSPGTVRPSDSSASKSPSPAAGGPKYHSKEQASASRSEAIDLDARDPHFAASLRSIGPVTPNPTFSHSSTFRSPQQGAPSPSSTSSIFPDSSTNPALLVVTSRARITKAAEQEAESFGRSNHVGREYLDVLTIRQILSMRDRQNLKNQDIERLLRLKSGVVDRLGERGVVAEVA